MIKRGWGRIIHVTTSFDTMLAAGLSAYGASKAGLEASCVSFSKDLEGTGVTVNILVPGGPVSSHPANRDLPFCSTPRSWRCRWYGSPRPNPTASAPAASSHATGIGACRRPRPRHGRAHRLHGPHSRRPRVQPAGIRCSRRWPCRVERPRNPSSPTKRRPQWTLPH
jgi:NAD(P)-dependent dehydrogenase (short-subunit alcohol dehydrogenase family)